MRLGYLLLTAAVAPLLTNGAASEAATPEQVESFSTNIVQNNEHGARLLRREGVDANDEERATVVLGGLIKSKEESKALISSWVSNKDSVEVVAKRLGVNTALSPEKAVLQLNWAAFKRFERLKRVEETGPKRNYAYFGTGGQTKKTTEDALLVGYINGNTLDDVVSLLGIKKGLSDHNLILHQNFRALKQYVNMQVKFQKMLNPIPFSQFDLAGGRKMFEQWAREGTSLEVVAQTLHLAGLTGRALMEHKNYGAFMLYAKYYLDYAPRRAMKVGRARSAV
ncbi:putative secreted RxLR effector protein [Phytophthora cinnamomi]|uniref:putative secreted RxLR effector protein n=1 Tax=Phytophthora cinnamomi TaxID=4785 RepID=UPI00355A6719|nr:putative secreted RxLR effector protein [Phytophthora cinnamomi]